MSSDRIAAARAAGPLRTATKRLLLAGYGVVLIAPLLLMTGVVKAGAQGRLVVLADAVGFVALSLLGLQIATSGRWRLTTGTFGLRPVLGLHRKAGKALLALVLLHVVVLLVEDPSRLALLDWRTAPDRARAGGVALLGLLALAWTSAYRERLRLSYERWRALHLALTAVVVTTAFVHVIWVGAYTAAPVVRWAVLALVLASAVALFWTRVAAPYAATDRPYRVLAVRPERGSAATLELAPVGHDGLRFEAGQFARLRARDRVYGMAEHPFSLSSSAQRPDRPSFTVKALGDFSAALADLPAGTEVLVDGPHGEAVHDGPGVRGRLLLAAGIGITPAMSVLRTAAERGERRPLLLLYGSRHWQDVTFREQLAGLERRLPSLRVVHTLSRPGPGWRGERGRVDAALLRRWAPPDIAAWSALICGPAAMVDETQATLVRLGMHRTRIQAEGFG